MPNQIKNSVQCFTDCYLHSPEITGVILDFAKQCDDYLENEKKRSKKLKNDAFQSVIEMRKLFAIIVTAIVFIWMAFVAYIILSVSHQWYPVYLSDKILLSLVGGSTINILGMLTIILTFCFSKYKS